MPLADLTWQSLRWLPIAVVAAGVAIAVTWWLYQPQLRLRSRWARWGLPLLRCVALGALAVALLKPVIHRPKTAAERGTLLVLLDHSGSMGVSDNRSPAQVVAIADALDLLPAGVAVKELAAISPEDIDNIRAQADRISRAASELDYARLADRGVDAAQTRLEESIAQMTTLAQSLQRPKEKPFQAINDALAQLIAPAGGREREQWLRELRFRIERVAGIAARTEGSAASKLVRESAPVREAAQRVQQMSREDLARAIARAALGGVNDSPVAVYGFAGELAPLDLSKSPAASAPATQPIEPVSDLTGAVRAAVARYPRDGVRAVVVLSDGRQIAGAGSVEAMAAAIGNVPVYTVRMAAPTLPRDLAVGRVVTPSRAFVGETLTVRVDVRSVGLRGDVPVTLTHGEEKLNKTLKFTDDQTLSAEFSVKLEKPGATKLAVSAAVQPGEISPANNAVERWVNVLSDKVRVVGIAQSAGRDYQFFADALQRTAWVQFDSYIAPAPDAAAVVPADKLAAADVVILEDASAKLLNESQWEQLRKLVTDRGGGAIVLAGGSHAPAGLLEQKDAAQLLPFANADDAQWRSWAGEYPTLRPVPYRAPGDRGRLADALRLTDDADGSLRRWHALPPMFRLLAITKLKPNATPLLVDSETGHPAMTESRPGGGRVVFVGLSETWRWRYKVGQRDQERFFLQLVRQVSDEPYAVTVQGEGGQEVSLDADRLLVEAGRSVRLRARVRDSAGKPSDQKRFDVTVTSADGQTRTETLNAVSPGRYERSVNWPEGEYAISPSPQQPEASSVPPATQPSPNVLHVRVARTAEAEMLNLAGDDRLLRRLAEATGGQSYAPEQLPDLPPHLSAVAVERPQIAETRLWDSPYLFAFVLACLGLEWAVRKQAGLA